MQRPNSSCSEACSNSGRSEGLHAWPKGECVVAGGVSGLDGEEFFCVWKGVGVGDPALAAYLHAQVRPVVLPIL